MVILSASRGVGFVQVEGFMGSWRRCLGAGRSGMVVMVAVDIQEKV